MSKGKAVSQPGFFASLVQTGLYKRTQGRIARQVTFAVFAIGFAMAAWRMYSTEPFGFNDWFSGAKLLFPGLLLLGGFWLGYRIVNMPKFADFLIAVEAEMNKVSWPSKQELLRSSIVVIFVIFIMAAILFGYDIVWRFIFQFLGVVYKEEAPSELPSE